MDITRFRVLLVLMFLIFSSSSVFAAVEVFSNYDTTLEVKDDNLISINKSLTLKNVYDVGIVPGQIEFKIGRGTDNSVSNIEVQDLRAVDRFGNEIRTQVRKTSEYSVIILDVYYPLLPGFEYTFDLSYSLVYDSQGIFFKSLEIPLRESTIPIEQGQFKVILPDNYHFTYVAGSNGTVQKNVATWEIKDDEPKSIGFEYSFIPVKLANLKGSYVFWITINIILLIIIFFEVRKELKKIRGKEGHHHHHHKR